jgi:O-antigen/teichoic acid export membrane protein
MTNELALNDLKKDTITKEQRKEKGNLKQRGYLNALTSIIDYLAMQISGMIVSPFIVHGLGNSMYGIWQMISQMTGYTKMADSRATQVLKWTVAKKQDTASEEELRSDVSSALAITFIILPIVLLAGGTISWYAPYITKADPAYYNLIRIVCSFLVLSMALGQVFEMFEAVLRGMNLGFKRMGFRAAIVVCGGALKVLAITQGFGLIGLAIVQIIVTVITGLTFYFIVKKNVGWFGFGKTNFKRVLSFGKLSGWYMANTATDTLLTQSDKVLLGFLTTPVLVSYYALTGFLTLAIQGIIFRVIIGIIPGIGKLFGLKDYQKISRVWGNLNDFIFILSTASGVTIILYNHSFLNAWVGRGHFAGILANTLIIVMVMQDTFIKTDGYIITTTLDLKKKIYLTIRSLVFYIGLGFLLVHNFGITGLCISLIIGKFLLFYGQRKIIKTKIRYNQTISPFEKIRPLAVSLSMLGIAFYLSSLLKTFSFLQISILAPVTFAIAFFIYYMAGLRREKREQLLQIVLSLKFFKTQ